MGCTFTRRLTAVDNAVPCGNIFDRGRSIFDSTGIAPWWLGCIRDKFDQSQRPTALALPLESVRLFGLEWALGSNHFARVREAAWWRSCRSVINEEPVPHRHRRRIGSATIGALVLAVALTGCGNEPAPATSPTPAAVGGAAGVSTASAIATTVPTGAGSASTAEAAPELTLGELTDRINAQWRDLTHFREISSSTAGPPPAIGSPIAAAIAAERASRSVREVALPDRARYVAEENGRLVFELIVIGDQVFARGTVATLLDPAATLDEWVVTDLDAVAGNPMLGEAAARPLAELSAPAYVLPERLRPQTVRHLGDTDFEGRQCALYGAADTTATGARIDLTFAVDENDRLCYIETDSPGIASRFLIEELADTFTIEVPADARWLATPAPIPSDDGPTASASPDATP
jgi:hypothetical protein